MAWEVATDADDGCCVRDWCWEMDVVDEIGVEEDLTVEEEDDEAAHVDSAGVNNRIGG